MHPLGCPTVVSEYKKYKETEKFKNEMSPFENMMKNISKHIGREVDDIQIIYHLYHTLTAENGMHLELPEWTKQYFPNGLIVNATLFEYETQSKTPLLRKLNGGLLIRKFLDDNIFRKKGKNVKVNMYSLHEDNVAGFLYALNVWKNNVPAYGSGIVVELHEKESQYYVKILYYKSIPAEYEVRVIPGYTEYRPLDKFLDIFKEQIPDWRLALDHQIIRN